MDGNFPGQWGAGVGEGEGQRTSHGYLLLRPGLSGGEEEFCSWQAVRISWPGTRQRETPHYEKNWSGTLLLSHLSDRRSPGLPVASDDNNCHVLGDGTAVRQLATLVCCLALEGHVPSN